MADSYSSEASSLEETRSAFCVTWIMEFDHFLYKKIQMNR